MQRLVTVAGKPTIRLGTKSPAGRRSIALDPATVAAVKAHHVRQLQERLAGGAGWQDHGLVFTREDGTPLRPTQLTRMFARRAREAGLPDLTLHGLRHTYVTASLQADIPPKVVSQRLGHANTAITSDLYQHVLKAMDAEAATGLGVLCCQTAVNGTTCPRCREEVKHGSPAQSWCRRGDLNPHVLADTRPSTRRGSV